MKRSFRVGLSGVSGIAQLMHLPILSRMKNVEVTAIFDGVLERAERVADKFKIKHVYDNFEDFIGSKKFDVLDICTPVNYHFSEAKQAMERGIHVLIEKPFVQNSAEASELLSISSATKTRVMSLMNLKFRPDAIALKSILQAGKIGDVFFVKSGWLRRNEKWRQKAQFQKNEQGVIMHMGLQLVDLTLWLLGNPGVKSVKANGFNQIMGSWVEDTAFLLLSLENNKNIAIEIGWKLNYGRDFLYANLIGENGAARLCPLTIYSKKNGQLTERIIGESVFHGDVFQKSYENEFAHYFFCLEHNQKMQSSGEELIEDMRIIDAAYQSLKTGKEVELR